MGGPGLRHQTETRHQTNNNGCPPHAAGPPGIKEHSQAMDVSRIRALRGPNLWSRHTAIEAIVSCTPAECAIDERAGFEAALRARFPAIGEIGRSLASALEARGAPQLGRHLLGLQARQGGTQPANRRARRRQHQGDRRAHHE